VRLATLGAPSFGALDASAMVTFAVGRELSTTVNDAVPPASVVERPLVGLTVTPAVSLSVFDAVTSLAFTLL